MQASCSDLINGNDHSIETTGNIIAILTVHEQKQLLYALIRLLSRRLSSEVDEGARSTTNSEDKAIGGMAALLVALVHDASSLQDLLISWLIGTSAEAVGQNNKAHRAIILTLSKDTSESIPLIMFISNTYRHRLEQINRALRSSLELFGDKLYIKHTPITHQEGSKGYLVFLWIIRLADTG